MFRNYQAALYREGARHINQHAKEHGYSEEERVEAHTQLAQVLDGAKNGDNISKLRIKAQIRQINEKGDKEHNTPVEYLLAEGLQHVVDSPKATKASPAR